MTKGEIYLQNEYGRPKYRGFKYVAYIIDNFNLRENFLIKDVYEETAKHFGVSPTSLIKGIRLYVDVVSYKKPKEFICDCYYDMKTK